MYQIVLMSDFIRNLKESTCSTNCCGTAVATVPAAEPEPLQEVAYLPRVRTGLAGFSAHIFGAAHRLLGAH
jgi:hypothetical protein